MTDKNQAPAPTEGAAALSTQFTAGGWSGQTGYRSDVPPQKASKSQPKADASEKAKSTDRDWLTTGELATKIGWREHALRDALRGKDFPGVRRTAFGYHIESKSLDEIKAALGDQPAKPNASRR